MECNNTEECPDCLGKGTYPITKTRCDVCSGTGKIYKRK